MVWFCRVECWVGYWWRLAFGPVVGHHLRSSPNTKTEERSFGSLIDCLDCAHSNQVARIQPISIVYSIFLYYSIMKII